MHGSTMRCNCVSIHPVTCAKAIYWQIIASKKIYWQINKEVFFYEHA